MTKILAKKFGKQLRYYREHAKQGEKMTLFDLASKMGWKGVAPLVLMEKGERIPRTDTIDELGRIMELSVADIKYLKGLAGYIEYTKFPPMAQLVPGFQIVEKEISQLRYPVTMIDYQSRYCLANMATSVLVGGSEDTLSNIVRQKLSVFDVVFDSRFGIRNGFSDPYSVELEQIFRFKGYNLHRRHEPFYQSYPECMSHLLPSDYKRFVDAWENCKVPVGPGHFLNFALHPRLSFRIGEQNLHFDLRSIELLHLDRMFNVSYYQPRTDIPGNVDLCETIFPETFIGKQCVRAWEINPQLFL